MITVKMVLTQARDAISKCEMEMVVAETAETEEAMRGALATAAEHAAYADSILRNARMAVRGR